MRIRNLFSRQRARNGLVATIRRGNQSCTATIRQGQNANQAGTEQEFSVEEDIVDVFVAAADYKPTGTASPPAQDDRISFTNPVSGISYDLRVCFPANSERCFSSCDVQQTELRVHTKAF